MSNTLSKENYASITELLAEELVPAMGCTEPIAIAYAAAKARDVLGAFPESADIRVSGSIIKNAKSVVVPHSGGMRGIDAALVAGLVAGKSEQMLEVLSSVTEEQIALMRDIISRFPVSVELAEVDDSFYINVVLKIGSESSEVSITGRHTNIV